MTERRTIKGRVVPHDHRTCELCPEEVEEARRIIRDGFPLAQEVKCPTRMYNCHGFALAESHAWFDFPELLLADDLDGVTNDVPAVGDVLVYAKGALITHTAVVTIVENGEVKQVHSKWAEAAELLHPPKHVPVDLYGEPIFLLRPVPKPAPAPEAEVLNTSEDAMSEEEVVRQALEKISTIQARGRLMLASTPEVRRMAIASLPGVKELIDGGPKAGDAVLEKFKKPEVRRDDKLSSILIYIMEQRKQKEAALTLAEFIVDAGPTTISRTLASDALLATTADTEVVHEDRIAAALAEAKRLTGK